MGTSAAGPEQMAHKLPFESQQEDFPDGPGATTPVPNSGGPGWISGQGTRPDMLQLRVCTPQLRILCGTNKTWCSQTNINRKQSKKVNRIKTEKEISSGPVHTTTTPGRSKIGTRTAAKPSSWLPGLSLCHSPKSHSLTCSFFTRSLIRYQTCQGRQRDDRLHF